MSGKKRVRRDLVFDLEMEHDNRVPAETDDLAKTLDYEALSRIIFWHFVPSVSLN